MCESSKAELVSQLPYHECFYLVLCPQYREKNRGSSINGYYSDLCSISIHIWRNDKCCIKTLYRRHLLHQVTAIAVTVQFVISVSGEDQRKLYWKLNVLLFLSEVETSDTCTCLGDNNFASVLILNSYITYFYLWLISALLTHAFCPQLQQGKSD